MHDSPDSSDNSQVKLLRPLSPDAADRATLRALLESTIPPGEFRVWRAQYHSPYHDQYSVPCSATLIIKDSGESVGLLYVPHGGFETNPQLHMSHDDLACWLGLADLEILWTRDRAEEERRKALGKRTEIAKLR